MKGGAMLRVLLWIVGIVIIIALLFGLVSCVVSCNNRANTEKAAVVVPSRDVEVTEPIPEPDPLVEPETKFSTTSIGFGEMNREYDDGRSYYSYDFSIGTYPAYLSAVPYKGTMFILLKTDAPITDVQWDFEPGLVNETDFPDEFVDFSIGDVDGVEYRYGAPLEIRQHGKLVFTYEDEG